jgi:nitrate reductase NapE component
MKMAASTDAAVADSRRRYLALFLTVLVCLAPLFGMQET